MYSLFQNHVIATEPFNSHRQEERMDKITEQSKEERKMRNKRTAKGREKNKKK
jgi:hypothetical protein